MTSILTNTSAMAALQTLRSVGAGLTRTQSQVSSGLRVKTAADNAAYWSIATTMRSDRKAVSAVADALGVGAAKVDVAYAGLDATIDTVGEIRAKLVAAKEKGVDKTKIQAEIDQLTDQLVSVAKSASFNGVNWLSTDAPENLWEVTSLPTGIASSFIRSSSGAVEVGQTVVDLADISLFNAGGGGALQKDIRALGAIGGLRDVNYAATGRNGSQSFAFSGPVTFGAASRVQFDLTLDAVDLSGGQSFSVTIDKATVDAALGRGDGAINSGSDFAGVLTQAFSAAGIPASSASGPGQFTISSNEATGEPGSSVAVGNVSSTFAGNAAGGLRTTALSEVKNDYPRTGFDFNAPFRIYRDVSFSFDVQVGNGPSTTATITRNTIDSVLGTSDGKVSSAADMARVLNAVLGGSGVDVSDDGGAVLFDIDTSVHPNAGRRASLSVGSIRDNIGPLPDFDITDLDITTSKSNIDNYLSGVTAMLQKMISAAATLGSVKSRVDLQSNFAQSLGDSIDTGIGRLVDADMEESSAKLAAQQTQQQLAVQALQIANNSAQGVLSLFRT